MSEEVRFQVLFADLFSQGQTHRTVLIVYLPLRGVAQYSVGVVDFLKLENVNTKGWLAIQRLRFFGGRQARTVGLGRPGTREIPGGQVAINKYYLYITKLIDGFFAKTLDNVCRSD